MFSQDEFGDAADSVGKSTGGGSEEVAGTFYEKRKYPLLPIGEYSAICCKVEVKDANPNGEHYREGEKKIHLRWQIQNERETGKAMGFPDSEDETKIRNYIVFNRPLGIAFGERASLQKLWKQLTGYDSEPFAVKTPKRIPMGNGKFKEGTFIVFPHELFENMTCYLSISHNEWQGEMRPNIDSITVSPKQREHNQALLPTEQVQQMPKAPGAPQAPALQAPAPLKEEVKVSTDPVGENVKQVAAAAGIAPIHEQYKSNVKPEDLPF